MLNRLDFMEVIRIFLVSYSSRKDNNILIWANKTNRQELAGRRRREGEVGGRETSSSFSPRCSLPSESSVAALHLPVRAIVLLSAWWDLCSLFPPSEPNAWQLLPTEWDLGLPVGLHTWLMIGHWWKLMCSITQLETYQSSSGNYSKCNIYQIYMWQNINDKHVHIPINSNQYEFRLLV